MKQSRLIAAAAAVSAVFGIGAASAADLPMKALPPMAPVAVLSWTGFYAGLNLGGDWSNSNGISHVATAGPCLVAFPGCVAVPNYSTTLAAGSTFAGNAGNNGRFTGGGQIGYNWQFGGGLAGIEADLNWNANNNNNGVAFASTTINPVFPAFPEVYTGAVSRSLDWLGTVRGRLGFLASPAFLLYGTGGLAYGGAKSATAEAAVVAACAGAGTTCAGIGGGTYSQTRVGWTVGAGGEWMFAPNWSLKAEYLYYDLGTANYATALGQFCAGAACAVNGGLFASTTGITSVRFTGSTARVGVNYHF